MSAYWIARAKINDPVQYRKYTDPIAAIIDNHGGRILVRGGRYEVLEGTEKFERHAVVEFPSMEAVLACYRSKEYQAARKFRLGGEEKIMRYGTANFGGGGTDWQQKINWDRLRTYRLESARARMKAHGLGAVLCMYDENVRYITSTLTPGWNRLKPGLRYAILCGDGAPVLFEQGDIGAQILRHSPWIPEENVRYSYAWIKGAAGTASTQQVTKFTAAIMEEMKRHGVAGEKLGVDFIDINMMKAFEEAGVQWTDGMSPMMEARAVKNEDEQECMRIVGAIGDAAHYECMKFLKPGLTENQVTAHIMQYLYSIPG